MGSATRETAVSNALVFNHHSLPYDREVQAAAAVPEFLRICVRGQRLGLNLVLIDNAIDASWFRVQLAPNYFWRDWYDRYKDKDDSKDIIRAFRSIVTRQPLFSHDDMELGVDLLDIKLVDDNFSYDALRAAYWHNSHLVGFPTRNPWNSSPIAVVVEYLDEFGDIQRDNKYLINLCSEKILDTVELAIRNECSTMRRTGKELFSDWQALYSKLTPCGRVQDQLATWSHKLSILSQVKESLSVLDMFAAQWADLKHVNYSDQILRDLGLNHEVSAESETVSNDPSLRKHREFWLPSGIKKYFENHIKLTMGFRIHFFCDESTRKVYVGYIGPHLPL